MLCPFHWVFHPSRAYLGLKRHFHRRPIFRVLITQCWAFPFRLGNTRFYMLQNSPFGPKVRAALMYSGQSSYSTSTTQLSTDGNTVLSRYTLLVAVTRNTTCRFLWLSRQKHIVWLPFLDTCPLSPTFVITDLMTKVRTVNMYIEEMYGSVSGIKPATVISHVSLEKHHPKTLFFQTRAEIR